MISISEATALDKILDGLDEETCVALEVLSEALDKAICEDFKITFENFSEEDAHTFESNRKLTSNHYVAMAVETLVQYIGKFNDKKAEETTVDAFCALVKMSLELKRTRKQQEEVKS